MRAWTTGALLIFPLLVGCANRTKDYVDPPIWEDKQARVDVRIDLAEALYENGAYHQTLIVLTKMRNEGIKHPKLDLIQGMCLARQGLFTEAEALLKEAQHKMKKDSEPLHELGVLYADSGRVDEALQAFEKAVELDPESARDWNNLGFLQFSAQIHDEAVISLRRAVSIDSTQARYRVNLAFALFATDKSNESLRILRSTLPKADAHYNFAVVNELAGDTIKANEHYLIALDANPNHQEARDAVARLEESIEESP